MNRRTELEIAILALMSYRDGPVTVEGLTASLRKHNAFDPEALENIGEVLDSLCSSELLECIKTSNTTSTYHLTAVGRGQLQTGLAQETTRD